jgi:hypothetical protein
MPEAARNARRAVPPSGGGKRQGARLMPRFAIKMTMVAAAAFVAGVGVGPAAAS